MKKLKNINNEILDQLPFKAQLTNDFPPFIYYKGGCIYDIASLFSVGIVGAFYTTGSRISLKDYSGEYRFDQTISSYAPGITTRIKLYKLKFKIEEYNNLYYSISKLNSLEYIELNGDSKTDRSNFDSRFFEFELGFNFTYIYKHFNIGLSCGYLIDFVSDFGIIKNFNPNLAGWNGSRLGLYTSYNF